MSEEQKEGGDGKEWCATTEGLEPLPPPDFTSFVFSMSTSALIDLGELENPETKTMVRNLDMAKHSIDLLSMLDEKTRGNLTDEESALLEKILADLRLRYCKYVK